jgi:hypothetical protein
MADVREKHIVVYHSERGDLEPISVGRRLDT